MRMIPLLFAQIREDAAVESTHFEGARRILAVASGGCTALALLNDEVELVHAVDANPAQTALLAHKVRAIAALDLADFLVVAGEEDGDRAALFARAGLTVSDEVLAMGLLHCGANERFYRFLGTNLRRTVLPAAAWTALLEAPDVAAQRAWLAEFANTERWRLALDLLLSRTTHEHFFPPALFAHIEERAFGAFFAERFAAEVSTRVIGDNPFFHQILNGRYPVAARPDYLTPEGYARVRRNLHKLRIDTVPLQNVETPAAPYDAVALSNVFDWAPESVAAAIAEHMVAIGSGARVVVRQMLDQRPLPPQLGFHDARPEHAALDRAMLYRAVHCGRLA